MKKTDLIRSRIAEEHTLAPLVSEAYSVFDLPAPDRTGVCRGCCMDPAIEARFLTLSPRDMLTAEIRDWFFAAHAEDIGQENLAWLLPRILELLAIDEDAFFYGEEVALSRLPLTGFPDRWPAREVEFVCRFAKSWFAERLRQKTAYLDESLCVISNGGISIDPCLKALWELSTGDLTEILHGAWFGAWAGRIWQTPFWNNQAQRTAVWNWYVAPELEERLVDAGLAGNDKAAAVADLILRTTQGGALAAG